MSIKIMSQTWQCSSHSGTKLLLLLAIADFADDEGKAFPSVKTLAKKIRMSERNTRYLLSAISQTAELRIEREAGPYRCNRYWIQMPVPANPAEGQRLHPGNPNPLPMQPMAIAPEVAVAPESSLPLTDPPLSTSAPAAPTKKNTRHELQHSDLVVASVLFTGIQTVVPKMKAPNLTAWANDVRLMREQDGRTYEEIRTLFAWANSDHFWRSNILSPAKLRQKWDTLEAKRLSSPTPTRALPSSFKNKEYGSTDLPDWAAHE